MRQSPRGSLTAPGLRIAFMKASLSSTLPRTALAAASTSAPAD
jgi:hypothetical protein